jgi:hypothetical protein
MARSRGLGDVYKRQPVHAALDAYGPDRRCRLLPRQPGLTDGNA